MQHSRSSQDFSQPRTPRLSGWILKFAVWLLESFLGSLILEFIWHKQGIIQSLRKTYVKEKATFSPVWPHPTPDASVINVESLPPPGRAAVAAHTVPGFHCIRDTDKSSGARRHWGIADYKQTYESHLLTPLDVAKAILDALEEAKAQNPPMLFLSACDRKDLLRQARLSTRRYQMEEPLSPLDGVPFAVIDALDALPYPTTSGTSYLAEERLVTGDAPCVEALRQAGAMLVGKTLLHELGLGMSGANFRQGTPRNPYNTAHLCGGSSSGSAAIVAAGLCAFALGIDGGGSVRVPAALCGLVGCKPTVGRTSHSGCPDNSFSIMSVGTIATCVGDAMIVSLVISNAGTGQMERSPAPLCIHRKLCGDSPPNSLSFKPLKGTRVGVYMAWVEQSSPPILENFLQATKQLASLGCHVLDVEIPDLTAIRAAQMASVGCEIAQASKQAYSDPVRRRQMNGDSRLTLANAFKFKATDYLQAQRIRTRLMNNLSELFNEVDIIVTPTVGVTAPLASDTEEADLGLAMELMRYTIPVNMAGLPSISVPMAETSLGLPSGIQLIGQAWKEADLFHIAAELERAAKASRRLPGTHFDILN